MTLTGRGYLVASGVFVTALWSAAFGIRPLYAVIIPGGIALLAGWVLIRNAESPEVERREIPPGFPGEKREIELTLSHHQALRARVEDTLPDQVRSTDGRREWPVRDGVVTYELVADRRGVGILGPITASLRDPIGLFERSFEIPATEEFVTYPSIQQLDWVRPDSFLLADGAPTRERHTFDRLRDYHVGDSLRDIHWRSSAKRPEHEFIVKEFIAESEAGAMHIVAESAPGETDRMASAAASIAIPLLDAGVPVGLTVADESISVDRGDIQRRRILLTLARTTGGRVDTDVSDTSAITIRAPGDGSPVTISTGDRTRAVDEVDDAGLEVPQ